MSQQLATPDTPWVPSDSFGARLILIRQQLGLTQAAAADAAGLDDGSWSNWENGASPRGMDAVVTKIHAAFGVDRDWLMWGGPLAVRNGLCFTTVVHSGQMELTFSDPPSLSVAS